MKNIVNEDDVEVNWKTPKNLYIIKKILLITKKLFFVTKFE